MAELFRDALIIGTGATLFMDLVALVLKHTLGIQPLNYALVGRWGIYLLHGRLRHHPITASPPIAGERWAGWGLHYLTGVVFACVLLWLVGNQNPLRFDVALTFGALSVLAPFLILQPGMGAGLAARRTPQPGLARLKSLLAHLSFGAGLWVAAFCWNAVS